MTNPVQILEAYWKEHPAWFGRPYGEYLHLGANQEMLRLLLMEVEIAPGSRVLDLGCALGGNARWLASLHGCAVEGVDPFRPAIETARKLAKAYGVGELCKFSVEKIEHLSFGANTFDVVVTTEGDVILPEVARVLKPGGELVGSNVAPGGLDVLEAALREAGLEPERLIDVTSYALAFYKAKEEEARLLLAASLMSEQDMLALQMHTIDMYEAGGASHALFRAGKPREKA